MKPIRLGQYFARLAVLLSLTTLLSSSVAAATEERFDVLRIGARTYQDVRVTTKAKNHIFITHSGGMTNIKVSELPADVLQTLGYASAPAPRVQTKATAVWARQTAMVKDFLQVKPIEAKLLQAWHRMGPVIHLRLPPISLRSMIIAAAILLNVYLFHCYCCLLICRKAGKEPGVLVWVPLVQALPMLRAASMSQWWFVTLFIPVLNLAAYVLWCVKIIQARNKTVPLLILLLLPVTNIFAFLYLAFSEGGPKNIETAQVEIMTLETA
jgi:hypothetical protein